MPESLQSAADLLFPSAMRCSCRQLFIGSIETSALHLFLEHSAASVGATAPNRRKPHVPAAVMLRCHICSDSVDADRYRHHLSEGRCRGNLVRSIRRYRKIINRCVDSAPSFECDNCLERDEFHPLDVASLLEHNSHDSAISFEVHVFCKACSCAIPLCSAVGHAALAHFDWIVGSSLADVFVTAPSVVKRVKLESTPNGSSIPLHGVQPLDKKPIVLETLSSLNDKSGGDGSLQRLICEPESSAYSPTAIEHHPSDSGKRVRRSARLGLKRPRRKFYSPSDNSSDSSMRRVNTERATGGDRLEGRSLSDNAKNTLVRLHHEGDFVCTKCGQRFQRKGKLKEHYTHEHKVRTAPHTCSICALTFAFKTSLVRHRRVIHKVDMNRRRVVAVKKSPVNKHHECENCGIIYRYKHGLTRHALRHTGQVRPTEVRRVQSAECDECGKMFSEKGKMRLHFRTVHLGERIPCPECELTFSQAGHLRAHRREVHRNERPFQCRWCGAAFARRAYYRHHEAMHEGSAAAWCKSEGEKACMHARPLHSCRTLQQSLFEGQATLDKRVIEAKRNEIDIA